MACAYASTSDYQTYTAYVSKLAELDETYVELRDFFADANDWSAQDRWHQGDGPESGSVTVVDSIQDTLHVRTYTVSREGQCEDRAGLFQQLSAKPHGSQARVIVVNYYRNWHNGLFSYLDRVVLDKIAIQYQIHPEILRLHFGSTYYLMGSSFDKKRYDLSPFLGDKCLHLTCMHGILTSLPHKDCICDNSNTRK